MEDISPANETESPVTEESPAASPSVIGEVEISNDDSLGTDANAPSITGISLESKGNTDYYAGLDTYIHCYGLKVRVDYSDGSSDTLTDNSTANQYGDELYIDPTSVTRDDSYYYIPGNYTIPIRIMRNYNLCEGFSLQLSITIHGLDSS